MVTINFPAARAAGNVSTGIPICTATGGGGMTRIKSGVTRVVILLGNIAIKIPNPRYGWSKFLYGLLSNMQESRMSCLSNKWSLAPTIWQIKGGWLNIQQRCDPISHEDFEKLSPSDFPIACDFKIENFGRLKGRIVLLDYGELT